MITVKRISGYEGLYGVTRDGRVWDYLLKRFLKSTINLGGYCVVRLYKINRTRKYYRIHRLVMAMWGNLDIDNTQTVVHHIDRNKSNNCIDNLRIMSDSEHCCSHKKGYGRNTETHKVCTKCMILKLRSKFNVARNNSDKLQNWCKSCQKECSQKYYQKLKENK